MITVGEIMQLIKRLKAEGKEWETLDAKQDLYLESKGDKAEFVKDVLALANSGEIAYIITGLADKTWEPMDITQHHAQDTLNQILKERCDPPLHVEYVELEIQGVRHGVVKIPAGDPPYIVRENCGGPISKKKHLQAEPKKEKEVHIHRGTVFVRRQDFNDGASRADLERIYAEKRRADLLLTCKVVARKVVEDLLHVGIEFTLLNKGTVEAGAPFFVVHFKEITQIVECTRPLVDATDTYKVPSITASWSGVIHIQNRKSFGKATVALRKGAEKIEAFANIKATNMNPNMGWLTIPLQGEHVQSL